MSLLFKMCRAFPNNLTQFGNSYSYGVFKSRLQFSKSKNFSRCFGKYLQKGIGNISENGLVLSKSNRRSLLQKFSLFVLGTAGVGGIAYNQVHQHPLKVNCEGVVQHDPEVYANNVDDLTKDSESNDEDELDDKTTQELVFPWREFLKLLIPDIWHLLAAVASALCVAYINIQIPLLLGGVVNILAKYTSGTKTSFTSEVRTPALMLASMYALQGLLTFFYISLLSAVGERLAARMRHNLFRSIIIQDIAFFDTHKTGEIVNRLTTDVQDFKSSFKSCISHGLRNLAQTFGCLVSLFVISPTLTGIMVVSVAALISAGSLMGSALRKLSRKAQAQVSKSTAIADEAISNVRTVRAFAMEKRELGVFTREIEYSSQLNQMLGVGIGIFQGLSNFALNGMVLGTLYVGGYFMSTKSVKAGDLMSFLVATQTLQRSLAQMSLLFGQAVRGISAGARVFEYMLLKPNMPIIGGKTIPYHTLTGHVKFQNVFFTYPNRANQTVLEDFSLEIPGGHMVALVGPSGGGKSTVAALLERFYDVDSGSITLDGHNLMSLDPSWLRGRAIGFINQEPVLFADTVMENIRYGCPGAKDIEVIEAAKLANAHDFIESFPDGYQTMIGERGLTVSGGQKQRIAIARALIKRPAILLLDEATSALDTESERVVQEAIDKIIKGRTVLVIAHRLSTVKDADIIAVVVHGKIVELGNHEELQEKKGVYWQMIKNQELTNDKNHHSSVFHQG